DYALQTTTRILNLLPTKKVDKTSYELWYGKVPNLSYLKVWGCEALVKRDTPDKLQQRYVKCIFIGYPKEKMGYYFYFSPENKIVVASEIPMEVEGFELPHKEEAPVHLESNKWLDAMNAEMQSMKDNQVWHLVDLPPNETFSPVADIRAIRILIAIAAFYDYEILQMDVKTDFLNGYLDETFIWCGFISIVVSYTRRDVAFVKIFQDVFNKNPKLYWTAVKNILKYLRNTKDMFLVYGGNPEAELRVDCYCDTGFETDIDDMKSQIGYVSF
ncbi:retrotransposon protein, putative, ty1-copia subclass, partial [Tanacetum coccineum]